jgi:hypothetical protein
MNIILLKYALEDFGLNHDLFKLLSKDSLIRLTNSIIILKPHEYNLVLSQQILLGNKKKTVRFNLSEELCSLHKVSLVEN